MSLSKGLQASAKDNLLPRFFAKENSRGMPQRVVLTLALIAVAISLLFIFLPSVGASYWAIEAIVVVGSSIRYLCVFLAAIRLRYKAPDVERAIKIPGGNAGVWIIAGVAFLIVAFAAAMTFEPPDQFKIGNPLVFDRILVYHITISKR